MKTPLVTVAIPTFNSSNYIEKALESILCQSYQNIEIYLIDNCSTDDTLKIASQLKQRYIDTTFYIIQNETNIGAEANFNKCLEIGNGKYIAIYHSDDIYHHNIVAKSVEFLENNNSIAVATASTLINETDEIIKYQKLPLRINKKSDFNFKTLFRLILNQGNFIVCPSVMMKKEIISATCKFNFKKFKTSSDLGLWLNISQNGNFGFINEQLIQYRIHAKQGSYLTKRIFTLPDIIKVLKFYKQFDISQDTDVLYKKFLLKYSTKLGYTLFKHKKNVLAKKVVNYNLQQICNISLLSLNFKTLRYFLKNLYLLSKISKS